MSREPSALLVTSLTEVLTRLHPAESYDQSVERLTASATTVIDACEAASLSVVTRHGVVTEGATGDLALRGDAIQYEEGEGPCLDAAMTERWVYDADLAATTRWPRSSPRLSSELGLRSMLSSRLEVEADPQVTIGSLNMYSTTVDGFTEDDRMLGVLLATVGAFVIDGARRTENLRQAIESRQVIGEAVGMLRAQNDVDRDEAFAMLTRASQRMNVKLRYVAAQVTGDAVPGAENVTT